MASSSNASALYVCLIAAMFAPAVMGHLCLVNPPQRGGISGVGTPESPTCFNTESDPKNAYCPKGFESGAPTGKFKKGSMASVTFELNASHYNAANPGHFTLRGVDKNGNAVEIATILDTGAPNLTNYTVPVYINADAPSGNFVLSAIYTPQNPQAPAEFLACADVEVY